MRGTVCSARALSIVAVLAGLVTACGTEAGEGIIVRDEDGCPRSLGAMGIHIDWDDVVRLKGKTYRRLPERDEPKVRPALVGEAVGVVRCKIDEVVRESSYRLLDGEATFLEPGTQLHEIEGMDGIFRIVALVPDPVVYEHRDRAGARTGADLLRFDAEQVVEVRILDESASVLGTIEDRDAVEELVEELQAGAVDSDAVRDLGERVRIFLYLAFEGQPSFSLGIYPDLRVTQEGLQVSEKAMAAIPRG